MSDANPNATQSVSALGALLADPELSAAAIQLQPGEYLFGPDRPPRGLYLIVSGLIRLSEPPHNSRPLARTLDWLGSGDLLGFGSLVGDGLGTQRARADEATRVVPLSLEKLAGRMTQDHRLALEVLSQLARRLESTQAEVSQIIFLEAPQRLASALLRLANHPALSQRDGAWAILHLTHADLASRTGISRETVSLILSRWRRQGAVKTGRRRLAVDPAKLAGLAR